ncbi:glycolate oxidase subunit GlcE [Candidatus Methylocalor cossyra]|uniref:Glycolate dehydrogenase, putative FAD-binding subunit n=1 Tax=Candidatus Methylocalor cossyra TaxID=3108543 RepID=A0ABM9NL48_9GAMM
MPMDSDHSEQLRQAVLDAGACGRPLRIVGGGSKAFYGRPVVGEPLEVAPHRGILSYQPSELVLTARAGTPLAEIEAVLAEHGQMLPFEPPHFGPGATLGGAVATGLSGPRRAFAGSVRDCVLGCRLLNGKGEILAFGGQVMKNVAGFDLARLMVGAQGTLGVLLEISLKVLPRPEWERTLVFPMATPAALATMVRWCREPWPVSGLAYDESWIHLRLSGTEPAVEATRRQLGGELAADGPGFWQGLKEQRSRFFQLPSLGARLWRLSLPPATPPLVELPGHWFYDWGGALRWLRSDAPGELVFEAARRVGGHATLFRGPCPDGRVFQPLPPALEALHRRLKRAFDPKGLFNPGRLYEDW